MSSLAQICFEMLQPNNLHEDASAGFTQCSPKTVQIIYKYMVFEDMYVHAITQGCQ